MAHALRRRLTVQLRRDGVSVRAALAAVLAASGAQPVAELGDPPGDLVDRIHKEWPADWLADPLTPGWCYQHLRNPERADRRDHYVRTQGKAAADDVPLVTQLYTPAFMVEHLLRPALAAGDVRQRRVLDPACGTGHFLVVAARMLADRRQTELGESAAVAWGRVVEDQLGGYDVDPLAARLCAHALQRLADGNGQPRIGSAAVAAGTDDDDGDEPFGHQRITRLATDDALAWARHHPAQVGAVIPRDWFDRFDGSGIDVPDVLRERWSVVATNPPFLDRRELNRGLMGWLKTVTPLAGGRNLFAAFVELAHDWLCEEPTPDGVSPTLALVLPQPFAFLPAFEKLRREWLARFQPRELVHLSLRSWPDATVDTLLLRAERTTTDASCMCRRLTAARDAEDAAHQLEAAHDESTYIVPTTRFARHPRAALAYWVTPGMWTALTDGPRLAEVAKSRQGMSTNDNARFLRYWWEVPPDDIGRGRRWVPYAKGGEFARWWGNLVHVIDWQNDGAAVRALAREKYRTETRTVKNQSFFFRPGITCTLVSSKGFSARTLPAGCIFDVGGPCTFPDGVQPHAVLAWLNSFAVRYLLDALNPTVNHQVGDLDRLPWPDLDHWEQLQLAELADRCIRWRAELQDAPSEPDLWSAPGRMGFQAPPMVPVRPDDFERAIHVLAGSHTPWRNLRETEAEIDRLVFARLGISDRERESMFRQFGRPHGWLPRPRGSHEPPPPAEHPLDHIAWEANCRPANVRETVSDDALEAVRETWAILRLAELFRDLPVSRGEDGAGAGVYPIGSELVREHLAPLPPEWIERRLPARIAQLFRNRPPFVFQMDNWFRVFNLPPS